MLVAVDVLLSADGGAVSAVGPEARERRYKDLSQTEPERYERRSREPYPHVISQS